MKIGILTYHRAENYGALLQAYALKTYLQYLGHEVSFVDYWPKYHSDYFKLFPWQQLYKCSYRSKIILGVKLILWVIPRYIRKKRFQTFMQEKLGLPMLPQYTNNNKKTENYDVVVYGSDQIWRKQNLSDVGFDDWYFGSDNVFANKKIVYAGSMGAIDASVKDSEYMQKMMKNFCAISVREYDLQSYLVGLGISASLVIDPVFLLSKEQWMNVTNKFVGGKAKYILFYNLLNTPESNMFAERLSKEMHLPIREINKKISFSHIGKRYHITVSIEEFLQLINDAELVVSNSFHGVAMSLVFEKQFYAVGMRQKSNRVKSLLQSIGISERYIESDSIFFSNRSIDYNEVGNVLQTLSNKSKLFIQESLD